MAYKLIYQYRIMDIFQIALLTKILKINFCEVVTDMALLKYLKKEAFVFL